MIPRHSFFAKVVLLNLVLFTLFPLALMFGLLILRMEVVLRWEMIYTEYFLYYFSSIVLITIGLSWFISILERKGRNIKRLYLILGAFLRFTTCLIICSYGYAKLFGNQFTTNYSVWDTPLREASGFMLTWFYFGYSKVLGTAIAILQIISGILLLFRKTQLIGALLLLPIITNILLINLFYDISLSAALNAVLITAICLYVIWLHFDFILKAVRQFYLPVPSAFPQNKWSRIIKYTLIVMAVGIPLIEQAYIRYNLKPGAHQFDGIWEIEKMTVNGQRVPFAIDLQNPKRIYFENEKLVSLKIGDNIHHGRIIPGRDQNAFKIVYKQGTDSLNGQFIQRDSQLIFNGLRGRDTVSYEMRLVRKLE